MSAENVKVAVRVRPFNQREKDANSSCIISMEGDTTFIEDPNNRGDPKKFAFDYSYWSHDGFESNKDGIFTPTVKHYADQRRVFDDLGRGVLDNAWQGYNATLFAYGQTGSGKSYSMLGYGPNKGIVPITCDELFKAIGENKDADKQFQVTFSMIEIYNEQVRDLLNSKSAKGGLKVRQHPKLGFFVDELKVVAVKNYDEIERWMEEGTVNRTTASTNMNATSSRSHMVITIKFTQILKEKGKSMTKSSEINLVDLAGSERADATGATGDRLKEGSAINQSLSTLGNVISALADKAMGKKNVLVPYRDSILTKLLMNALGGNSRTIMIAALSPAAINFDETLSTLRYADRAKKIKNMAVVNEDPTERLIRELKEENARLMAMLSGGTAAKGLTPDELAARQAEASEMQEKIAANERQMEEMGRSWEQRLEDARKDWESQAVRGDPRLLTTPYLQNINEDSQLSGVIKHVIDKGEMTAGTAEASATRIQMRGLSLQKDHAVLINNGKTVTINPMGSSRIIVNGQSVTAPRTLQHNDRVLFGSNNLYIFVGFKADREKADRGFVVDWDFCQNEIAAAQGLTRPENLLGDGKDAKSQEIIRVREDLVRLLPMVSEANAMSEELGKGLRFDLVVRSGTAHSLNDDRKEVMVKVASAQTKFVWLWPKGKFVNRKYLMQEMWQQYIETCEQPSVEESKDPFWDPPEDIFLGSAHVYLQSLGYMIDMNESLAVTNYQGHEEGILQVAVACADPKGRELNEESFVEAPKDLLGKRMDLIVKITSGRGVKWVEADGTRSVFCRFKFYADDKLYETPAVGKTMNPDFKFRRQFTVNPVTDAFLWYLEADALVVEVWGKQGDGKGGGAGSATLDTTKRRARAKSNNPATDDSGASSPSTAAEGPEIVRLRERVHALEAEVRELRATGAGPSSQSHSSGSAGNVLSPDGLSADDAALVRAVASFARLSNGMRNEMHACAADKRPDKDQLKHLKEQWDERKKDALAIGKLLEGVVGSLKGDLAALAARKK